MSIASAGALVAIGLLFVAARRTGLFALLAAVLVLGFTMATRGRPGWSGGLEWLVASSGLGLTAFGLLILRVMLHRSVSLRLLERIASGDAPGDLTREIERRLADLDALGLARHDAGYRTTALGALVGGAVGLAIRALRIP